LRARAAITIARRSVAVFLRAGADVALRRIVTTGLITIGSRTFRVRATEFTGTLRALAVARRKVTRPSLVIAACELISARTALRRALAFAVKQRTRSALARRERPPTFGLRAAWTCFAIRLAVVFCKTIVLKSGRAPVATCASRAII
jgi:hypothetical protein